MPKYENCPNLCFVNQSFNNLVCNNENEHYKYIYFVDKLVWQVYVKDF